MTLHRYIETYFFFVYSLTLCLLDKYYKRKRKKNKKSEFHVILAFTFLDDVSQIDVKRRERPFTVTWFYTGDHYTCPAVEKVDGTK